MKSNKINKFFIVLFGVSLVFAAAFAAANAGNATETMAVSATVTANCTVSSNPLYFSNLTPNHENDTQTTITVNCPYGNGYYIELDSGQNSSGNTRYLASGSNKICYQIFKDQAHTQIWGSSIDEAYAGTGTGSDQEIPAFGLIAATNSPAGNYTDTIGITVVF